MFDSSSLKEAFGRAAPDYDQHAQLQQEVRADCLQLAQDRWPADAHILDIGCGTGGLWKDARAGGFGWEITGVDLALGMCREASQHGPTANASADALPFADESFDGLFSSLMLQWVNDPLAVMKEMARVTRPQGCCVISTFTRGTPHELQQSFAAIDGAAHVNDFAEAYPLTAFASHAGFRLMTAEEEGFVAHYADVVSLMRSLKAIGASTKHHAAQRKSLMTPRQLKRLENAYWDKFGSAEGFPATWEVLYMLMEKV